MDFTCAVDAISLPVELTDGIIDYLVDDRSSLRATSLVCRAWCPRSRRHLFHTVHVKAVRKSFRSFLAFLNHNDERPGCSPPIARLIRCLHLYGSRRCDFRSHDDPDEVVSTITSALLMDLFAILPGLKELSLEAMQFDTRLYPAARLNEGSPPKFQLDFLSMKNVWTVAPAGDDFTHMLSMFTNVGTLRIVTPFWPTFPVQPVEAAVTPPIPHIQPCFPDALAVTRIEACARMFTPYLLSLMRRTPSVASLREVDVACRSLVDVEALGNFFEVAGPTLDHVTLDLVELFSRNQIRSDQDLQILRLDACTSLTSLSFRITLLPEGNFGMYNTSMFMVASGLLGLGPRATVENVTFKLLLSGSAKDLRCIRDILDKSLETELHWLRVGCHRVLANFRRLCFRLECIGSTANNDDSQAELREIENVLRGKFAEIDKKGMLAFEQHDLDIVGMYGAR